MSSDFAAVVRVACAGVRMAGQHVSQGLNKVQRIQQALRDIDLPGPDPHHRRNDVLPGARDTFAQLANLL